MADPITFDRLGDVHSVRSQRASTVMQAQPDSGGDAGLRLDCFDDRQRNVTDMP